MFYRTYITTFVRSNGVHYYAGKRKSKYENPVNDPYFGSGREITNAFAKYGRECILSTEWFEHTEDTYASEEIKLIASVKERYGDLCVNKHIGGEGGNTLKFCSDEEKANFSSKCATTMKKNWANPDIREKLIANISASAKTSWLDDNKRKLKSETVKQFYKDNPKYSQNLSNIMSERNTKLWQDEEYRTKITDATKRTQRSGVVWDLYYSGELVELWNQSENLKYKRFFKWLNENTEYTVNCSSLKSAVNQMEKDTNEV